MKNRTGNEYHPVGVRLGIQNLIGDGEYLCLPPQVEGNHLVPRILRVAYVEREREREVRSSHMKYERILWDGQGYTRARGTRREIEEG